MSDRASVSIDSEIKTWVDKYADKKGLTVAAALDKLLTTAFGRLEALSRYAKVQKANAPAKTPKEKKVKVAKTKKEPKPKAAKPAKKKTAAKKQLSEKAQAKVDAAATK